jgi:hypothetical protein
MFGGENPDRPDLEAEIRAGDDAITLKSAGGRVTFQPGPAVAPDLVISGPPDAIIGLLAGRLDQAAAAALGVSVLGDLAPLMRLHAADWLTGPEIFTRR